MSDTDKVKGGYCSKQEMVFYLNAVEEVKRLRKGAKWLRKEVKRLREQYTELREALVGDSPNWTHEELIEKALERERHVAFMQWMIEHYDEIVNEWEASE